MNVTCPQCKTVYRLPDDKAKAGAKLRCSVCRHVFALPEAEPVEEALSLGDEQEKPEQDSSLEMNGLESSSEHTPLDEGLSLGGEKSSGGLDIDDMHIESKEESEEQEAEEAEEPAADTSLDMPEQKSSRFEGMFGLLLCLAIIGGGVWAWQNTNYLDGIKALFEQKDAVQVTQLASSDSGAENSAIAKLELLDVTQYQVKNEKIGRLVVIEGKVRNNFNDARELISLEAELHDKEGKVLASRRQIAGISLSPFQLELLDKTELENTLNRKLDIITSNINVMPGAEVPFTVVFSDIPAGASDYKVRIVDAAIPGPIGNLSK